MTTNVFQLIDFDRTLFDTTGLIEAILDSIKRDDPKLSAELQQQSEESYKEERTFLLLRYLREHKSDVWVEELVNTIITERGVEAFMLPGAHERLKIADELSSARPAWGILTYGDPVDQLMKIRLAGLEDAPIHIVTTADKGGLITSWQTADGTFQLPPEFGSGVVDQLTFEDDKLQVFKDTPDALIGVWVTQRDDATVRLAEMGLSNVAIVHDLHESIKYLQLRLQK